MIVTSVASPQPARTQKGLDGFSNVLVQDVDDGTVWLVSQHGNHAVLLIQPHGGGTHPQPGWATKLGNGQCSTRSFVKYDGEVTIKNAK